MKKEPVCYINTDDNKSMNSELQMTIDRPLGRVFLKHRKQYGEDEIIQVFPSQIDTIVRFLTQSKEWIESGYKEQLKPESYLDDKIFDDEDH